ncbi:hypothetical protein G7Z17_g6709 [Cylindrodendrum hubeiense]|uniref:Uncharacterized protein n=1 Tax=Cylindrodendrum hubeiense TaxID=595255 RepID=A0A9P5H4W3_9HYPO|nr:hypothetical protein G7Z17_g6709 [Cylindrodendrum hubeiense]
MEQINMTPACGNVNSCVGFGTSDQGLQPDPRKPKATKQGAPSQDFEKFHAGAATVQAHAGPCASLTRQRYDCDGCCWAAAAANTSNQRH